MAEEGAAKAQIDMAVTALQQSLREVQAAATEQGCGVTVRWARTEEMNVEMFIDPDVELDSVRYINAVA